MAKATKDEYLWIRVTGEDGGYVESQSVEAHLLYNILEKLEEIRCNQIDLENEVEKANRREIKKDSRNIIDRINNAL